MDKVTVPILFEICTYLQFKEMVCLARLNKHFNVQMMDKILIIFSEREAQRLLFSKWSLLRNPFVEQEEAKTTLKNNGWFDFLKCQVQTRKWLKIKLWNVLPSVFGEYNDDEANK